MFHKITFNQPCIRTRVTKRSGAQRWKISESRSRGAAVFRGNNGERVGPHDPAANTNRFHAGFSFKWRRFSCTLCRVPYARPGSPALWTFGERKVSSTGIFFPQIVHLSRPLLPDDARQNRSSPIYSSLFFFLSLRFFRAILFVTDCPIVKQAKVLAWYEKNLLIKRALDHRTNYIHTK